MSKPVGIICATENETAPFLERLEFTSTQRRALVELTYGTLDGVDVVVACSGICKTNAAMAAQIVIDAADACAIVNAGTAGGINPEVDLFDMVVADCVEHHDVDAQTMLVESYPFYPSGVFPCDAGLLEAAREAAEGYSGTVRFGKTVSGEQFIDDVRRDEIVAATAGLSVDMEGAAMAQVCFANQVPFLVVRGITDTAAHDGYGTYEQNRDKASLQVLEFTCALVKAYAEK